MRDEQTPSADDHEARLRLARAVRDACLAAARDAGEDAGVRGLCADGALEAALGAIQSLDLDAVLAPEGARAPSEERDRAGSHPSRSSGRQGRMPVLFVGHGSPMNTLERNRYTNVWRSLGASLPKPRAILSVSAHWYAPGVAVTPMAAPPTIHDFRGFPELFAFEYPAPGDPRLACRVGELLAPAEVAMDKSWGLDHGTWSVLAHLVPGAGVPVVQLRLDATRSSRAHYALASRLAPLRDEGVLVLGSGNAVHNLARIAWEPGAQPHAWASEFEGWVRDCVLRHDHEPLLDYAEQGRAAALSVPTPDHYWPLLYVLALQRADEDASIAVDGIELGSIGMLSVVIGG